MKEGGREGGRVQLSPVGVAMALPSLLTEPFPVFDLKSLFRPIPPLRSAFMTQLRLQRGEGRTKIRPPFSTQASSEQGLPACLLDVNVVYVTPPEGKVQEINIHDFSGGHLAPTSHFAPQEKASPLCSRAEIEI